MNLIPFDQLQAMGNTLAKSGLFGIKSPDQAIALMLVAQAEQQHPATIAQDYDIIQGRAARKTHSVLARFQQSGGRVEWHSLTDTKADATFSHPQGVARIEWTIEQARKAGLAGKDNWKNYPRAMLRARCIAEGVRAAYPAAIGGMLVSEEARDVYAAPMQQSQAKHMGAADVVEPDDPKLVEAQSAADRGTESLAAWWKDAGKETRQRLAGHLDTLKARAENAAPPPALPPAAPAPDSTGINSDEWAAEYKAAEAK